MREVMRDQNVRSRVLLVEDVDAMRLYLRLALERYGFDVVEAPDLGHARQYLRTGNYLTSVLLDLELPDGHGLDIIEEIPPEVPVAAISADDSREIQLQCRDAGCATVLNKNERLADLGRVLQDIERRQPQSRHPSRQKNSKLASRYLSFLAESRVELQRARSRNDFDGARRIAHRLRGTAVHFGYRGIGTSARALGQAIASGDIKQIEAANDVLIERLMDAADSHGL